jgi:hypothetical protein
MELKQVAAISTLADCAKNIPQRLLDMAVQKGLKLLTQNDDIKKLAAKVNSAQSAVKLIQTIAEKITLLKEDPDTFLKDVLSAQGLTGTALQAKIEALTQKYSALNNVSQLIDKALTSGICGQQNFYPDGSAAPKPSLFPTDVLPEQIPGVIAGVQNEQYDFSQKDKYDAIIFQIKEVLAIEQTTTTEQSNDLAKMTSVLASVVMGYHDKVSKTRDSSNDKSFYDQFIQLINDEMNRNSIWPNDVKETFKQKSFVSGNIIRDNSDEIREFFNKNLPASGSYVSVGVTVYSGPASDYTTFLDIKPEQRPPELVEYYTNQGYSIPPAGQQTYTNSAGKTFKIGTLNYSDAFTGAYREPLISDYSVASTRFPGGSILLLKNPDGTAYNPTGKNQKGIYKVMDTGSAELTYKKPDIFTLTPKLYKNMASVQVFLVSRGSKTFAPQYQRAQSLYGGGS